MKHEYTDTQLRQAVADFLEDEKADLSVSALGEPFWTQQVKALRKMLDALPEPKTDDWQQCRFEDIHKGDQIKYVTEISTVIPHRPVTEIDQGDIIIGDQIRITSRPDAKYYRIPAPVVHPDPAVHKLIRCNVTDRILMATPDGGYISEHGITWPPSNFEDWTPAKVVEDDR